MKLERFLSKIQATSDCWKWLGYKDSKGYGGFFLNGKMRRAHRVSFEIFKEKIIGENVIMHECDNPECVNPEHLKQGLQFDNMMDAHDRNRFHAQGQIHCKRGHELKGDNLIVYKNSNGRPARHCIACQKVRYENRKNTINDSPADRVQHP